MRLSPILLSFASVLAMGTAAQAQIARTPLAEPVEITGRTGGNDASACGAINLDQSQTIRVSESFASLSFEVKSEGDYTLFITGENGFSECVFAHNYDGGVIQAPGLLDRGTYQVYVGDRSGERHPYTLTISQ
ncbi:MAG: hypothetical protein AAGN15_01615 [Cyanobacteria bacterium J06581_3]